MEGIKSAILKIFPEMENELLKQLLGKIEELGAETETDLKFLEAQDFNGILKPIQARKLLKMVQEEVQDKNTEIEDSSAPVQCNAKKDEVVTKDVTSIPPAGNPEGSSTPKCVVDEVKNVVKVNNIPVSTVGKPWPTLYVFPENNLRQDVQQKLNEGVGKHDRRIKKAIITTLFNDLMMYRAYPTPDMYVTAAKSVVRRYSFLQDTNPCSNPHDSWKLALSEKFRNERRNMQLPSVVKRKKTSMAGPLLKRQVKNWTTSRPTGEDDVSIGRHKVWLQAEAKKSRNLDEEKMSHLMKLTYSDRRKMVQENCPIKDIKKEFPALFQVEQLHAEFTLLMNDNLEEKFISNMKPIFRKIMNWPFSRKEDRAMATKAMDLGKDEPESDAFLIAGSFLLPRVLLENQTDLFVEGGKQFTESAPIPSTPVIVYTGDLFTTSSFTIMAENEEICHPASLYSSLFSLVATFYCFNLEYPPKVKRTLEFLQKIGLALLDGKKLSPRVASVYAKLKL